MGIQERKEREKEALRKRIIEAATRLFQEESYDAVSMRKIAREVEYSVGTLYLHYKDKDELFLAVQEAAFERAFSFIQQLPKTDDPMVLLKSLGERYISFGLHNPGLYRLMFMMDHPMKALNERDGWRSGMKLHQLLSQIVEAGIEVGKLPAVNPTEMSFALWSFVHGMVALKITCRLDIYSNEHLPDMPQIEDTEAMITATHDMLLQILAKSKV